MASITDLDGRVALVTGGAKNIGKMVATKFAQSGASVAITYQQNKEAAFATCEELRSTGLNVIAVQVELTEKASIDRAIAEVQSKLGPVDILVNNAAIRPQAPTAEITQELWDLVLNTNTRGPFFFSQALVGGMMERGYGRLLYHGGVHASFGARNAALGSSKLACVGMMRSFSSLGAAHGVTANVVVPGFVNTHHDNDELYGDDSRRQGTLAKLMIGRLSEPEDVANLCLFLASPGASYITGQELFVTGGIPPQMGAETV